MTFTATVLPLTVWPLTGAVMVTSLPTLVGVGVGEDVGSGVGVDGTGVGVGVDVGVGVRLIGFRPSGCPLAIDPFAPTPDASAQTQATTAAITAARLPYEQRFPILPFPLAR